MPKRIVTREIADEIYNSYEALRTYGYRPREAFKTIQSDIFKSFGVEVSGASIERFAYHTFDKERNCDRNYYQKHRKGILKAKKESRKKQRENKTPHAESVK